MMKKYLLILLFSSFSNLLAKEVEEIKLKVPYDVLSSNSLDRLVSGKAHIRVSEYMKLLKHSGYKYKLEKILIEGEQIVAISKGEDRSFLVMSLSDKTSFKVKGAVRTSKYLYIKSISPSRASLQAQLGKIYLKGEGKFEIILNTTSK